MGQDESTLRMDGEEVEDIERIDGALSVPKLLKCPHCVKRKKGEGSIATYRCRLQLDDLRDIYKHKSLLPYWKPGFTMEDGTYNISYVACENCIAANREVRNKFTHHPEGWIDDRSGSKHALYELADVKI